MRGRSTSDQLGDADSMLKMGLVQAALMQHLPTATFQVIRNMQRKPVPRRTSNASQQLRFADPRTQVTAPTTPITVTPQLQMIAATQLYCN